MIHLLNGTPEVRVRSSEGCTVLPCGCAHTSGEVQKWLQMCDACHATWQLVHAEVQRARAEAAAP